MKIFYNTISFRDMLKPLATLILLFALFTGVNAQVLSVNKISAPAVTEAVGSFDPGVLIGSAVTVTDALGSNCPNVTYEWQSATNEEFTENFKRNISKTKDCKPGTLTTTTYFRRVVKIDCLEPDRGTVSTTGEIKITIN